MVQGKEQEATVQALLQMGFERTAAVTALNACNWDKEAAITRLCSAADPSLQAASKS